MSDRMQISEQPSMAEIQLRNEGFKVDRETPHRGEEDQPMTPEEERRKVEPTSNFYAALCSLVSPFHPADIRAANRR